MPQFMPNESGQWTRVSTSGKTAIGTTSINLLGIWVGVAGTAPQVNMYVGSTAGVSLIGTATLALATFYRMPAYCSGGLVFQATNDSVDVTLFWNPAG